MKDLGRNISCLTCRGPLDHTGYTVGIDFVWISYVKKYQVCSRRARVWAKLSLQESAKLIHMVLTVLCARSSCREAVAREKRIKKKQKEAKNKMTGSGHLFFLIKFCSIWFEDGCLIFKIDFWRWLSYFQNRTGAHSKWEKRQSDRRARNNTQSIAEQLYSRVTLKNNLTK